MSFVIERRVDAPAPAVFAVLSDVRRHAQGVPLTHIETDPGDPGLGWSFVARTRFGPLTLDDPMVISGWQPPSRFRLVKTGWWLSGWAQVEVRPDDGGSIVVWTEHLRLRPAPLGWLTAPLADPLGRRVFTRALDRLLDQVPR